MFRYPKKKSILLYLFIPFNIFCSFGQINFVNGASWLTNNTFKSSNAIVVADIDRDGLDDICRLNQGYQLSVEKQKIGQVFENTQSLNMGSTSALAMVIGDINGNKKRDVLAAFGNNTTYTLQNNTNFSFGAPLNLPQSNLQLVNLNFSDIENDGDIDIMGCNELGENQIWINNGNGLFALSGIINFDITPNITGAPYTDDSGNWSSIFSDFDNDGDLDLYVAKNRQGVPNASDPRRINTLFVNNGDGTYSENAALFGLNIGTQSSTANWDDINNDGWFDLLLTNQDSPTQLLLNNQNGTFTNINQSNAAGLNVTFLPLQSKMADFDNDGWLDVLITGSSGSPLTARLFRNNGNNTFTPITSAFPSNNSIHSFAIGDLNHDGRLDIYAGYAVGYTTPSTSINDILWINDTQNENNFVSFNLEGTLSNKDAIGARVYIYGDWGIQTREVRAGDGHGNCNTLTLHFGLGNSNIIDSTIIKWPSGLTTKFTEQSINQFYHVIENDCVSPISQISIIGNPYLCSGSPGSSVTLSAPTGSNYSYIWSTGDTSQSIQVGVTGNYSVQTKSGNCYSYSPPIYVESNPDQTPVIQASGPLQFCAGDSVTLEGPTGMSFYQWSDGSVGQSIQVSQPGLYTLTIAGICENFTSAPILVEVDTLPIASIISNGPTEFCDGGIVSLSANSANVYLWNNGSTSQTINVTQSGSYTVQLTDLNGCSGTSPSVYVQVNSLPDAIITYTGTSAFCSGDTCLLFANTGNDLTYEWLFNNSIILGANSNYHAAFLAGNYRVIITDSNNCSRISSPIQVIENPLPTPTFTVNNTLFTSPPFAAQFTNTTLNPTNYSFTWLFGDGTVLNSNNLTVFHQYQYNGLYTVMLIAVDNSTGCRDTLIKPDYIFCTGGITCTLDAQLTIPPVLTSCQGDTILLSCNISPSASYQWYRNGIAIQGAFNPFYHATLSGSYSVLHANAVCSDMSNSVIISFTPPPAVPLITPQGNLTFCSGGSVTLLASQGYNSYEWSTGTTGQALVVSNSGIYSVTAFDSNGCGSTSLPFVLNASLLAPQEICIVGVDSLTNKNMVVWEKPVSSDIEGFVIYKETNAADIYNAIGNVAYDSLSVFLDINSNPSVQAYRYKISALDTCGMETVLGNLHKTIHLTINQGVGSSWNLIWNHYEGFVFPSYNIYRGTTGLNLSLHTTISSNLNSYTDLNPPSGNVYYQIEVINPGSCDPSRSFSSSRSNMVNVIQPTSQSETTINQSIIIYPNPTNDRFIIKSSEKFTGKHFTLTDIQGKHILFSTLSGVIQPVDITHLAPGVYFLTVEGSGTYIKVVKQ